jgi:hypothetical protein
VPAALKPISFSSSRRFGSNCFLLMHRPAIEPVHRIFLRSGQLCAHQVIFRNLSSGDMLEFVGKGRTRSWGCADHPDGGFEFPAVEKLGMLCRVRPV